MLLTVEGYYHDGKIDIKELPKGITESKILITFLEIQENKEISAISWDKLTDTPDKVD